MRAVLAVAIVCAAARLAVASGHHCHETSHVVGRARCSSFGSGWAASSAPAFSAWVTDSAFVVEHLELPAIASAGPVYNASGASTFHASMPRGPMWAMGYRTGARLTGRHWLAGIEVGIAGSIGGPSLVTTVDNNVPVVSQSETVFDAGAIGGVHTRVGSFDFSTLLVVGDRSLSRIVALPDGYSSCVGGVSGKYCGTSVGSDQLRVEARGGIDVWLGPHVTLGVSAGIDLAHTAESFALELHFYGAPYLGN